MSAALLAVFAVAESIITLEEYVTGEVATMTNVLLGIATIQVVGFLLSCCLGRKVLSFAIQLPM